MHRATLFRLFLFAFLGGVFIASFFRIPPIVGWAMLIVAVVVGYWKHRWSIVIWALLMFYGADITQRALFQDTPLLGMVGQTVTVQGYVDGDVHQTDHDARFPLRVGDERVLIIQAPWPERHYGEPIEVAGDVSLPKNTPDFDYAAYLRKDGIRTVMQYPRIVGITSLHLSMTSRLWVGMHRLLFGMRDAFTGSLIRSIHEPVASYVVGILVGVRQSIPAALTAAFARTGTSHILAISGYNITIIVQMLMVGLLRVMPSRRALIWALAGVAIFTVFVGAGSSVVRAAIMGSLVIIAGHVGRLPSASTAILLSAALMSLFNPLLVRYDAGFQLSFLAVTGLIYGQPILDRWLEKKVTNAELRSLISATLSAQIVTLPLLLHSFGSLSPYALLVNVLVLPFVPVAMLLGCVTAVAGLVFAPLGKVVGLLAWSVGTYQLSLISWFSRLPGSGMSFSIPASLMVSLYVILSSWYLLYGKRYATVTSTHA